MEDYLLNYLSLQTKWNRMRKSEDYIHMNKNQEELKNHLAEVENYEREVAGAPLYESYRKNLLGQVSTYKQKLNISTSQSTEDYIIDFILFLSSICFGGLLFLMGRDYARNKEIAMEKGFKEAFEKIGKT